MFPPPMDRDMWRTTATQRRDIPEYAVVRSTVIASEGSPSEFRLVAPDSSRETLFTLAPKNESNRVSFRVGGIDFVRPSLLLLAIVATWILGKTGGGVSNWVRCGTEYRTYGSTGTYVWYPRFTTKN
jgi:hypothetical protein